MTMAKSKEEQIFIGVDDQVIELTGEDKEAFLADKAQMRERTLLLESVLPVVPSPPVKNPPEA